jgi:hypothetical protein
MIRTVDGLQPTINYLEAGEIAVDEIEAETADVETTNTENLVIAGVPYVPGGGGLQPTVHAFTPTYESTTVGNYALQEGILYILGGYRYLNINISGNNMSTTSAMLVRAFRFNDYGIAAPRDLLCGPCGLDRYDTATGRGYKAMITDPSLFVQFNIVGTRNDTNTGTNLTYRSSSTYTVTTITFEWIE